MTARFYYEDAGQMHYLDEATGMIGQIDVMQRFAKGADGKPLHHYFELMKGYDKTAAALYKYKDDFNRWHAELLTHDINFKKYYTNYDVVEMTFRRWSTMERERYDTATVTMAEYKFNEKTNNGGIMYFDKDYANKETQCYGYDFSAFYPTILCNKHFKMPIKATTPTHIDSMDFNKIQYGIYRVFIKCEHPMFNKVFCYSKNHYYTHYSLWFAAHYREQYGVQMTLDTATEHNALIYANSDLIAGKDMFGNWYKRINDVKTECKGNKLAKHLASSIVGTLIKFNRIFKTDDEIADMDVAYDEKTPAEYMIINSVAKHRRGGVEIVNELIQTAAPYKYGIARMKPYLLSLARNICGMILLRNDLAKDCIRIQTDGFVLTRAYECDKHMMCEMSPVVDEKTTGVIVWKNVNRYEKNVQGKRLN